MLWHCPSRKVFNCCVSGTKYSNVGNYLEGRHILIIVSLLRACSACSPEPGRLFSLYNPPNSPLINGCTSSKIGPIQSTKHSYPRALCRLQRLQEPCPACYHTACEIDSSPNLGIARVEDIPARVRDHPKDQPRVKDEDIT